MFPFRKVTLKDKQEIEGFTDQFSPYSDFNFTSLWSYNTENDMEFFLDDNTFAIRIRDYITNKVIYSFLSKNAPIELVHFLLNESGKRGLKKELRLVPEISLNEALVSNPEFVIEEDRDSFDYIISAEATASLTGVDYENKRQHISQFSRLYSQSSIKISNCKNQSDQKSILQLFDLWAKKKTTNIDITHERLALHRLFHSIESLDITCIEIWDNDRLIGFTLDEKINGYALGHFMKADKDYRYIYDMLLFQSAKYWRENGCEYINYEQDMGIEGLRKMKSSWHPVKFLKKYTISVK